MLDQPLREHGDSDLLVHPLVMVNLLSLHGLRLLGGPQPIGKLAVYRQGRLACRARQESRPSGTPNCRTPDLP